LAGVGEGTGGSSSASDSANTNSCEHLLINKNDTENQAKGVGEGTGGSSGKSENVVENPLYVEFLTCINK